MKAVFTLKRLGPRGADTNHHQFCVAANGNPELVRTGESGRSALITGARSSDPEACRKTVQRLCSELNAVVARFSNGEFHEEQFAPGTRVMTDQGRPGTVVGHTEYDTALVRFDDADGEWEWPDERLIVQEFVPVLDSAGRETQERPAAEETTGDGQTEAAGTQAKGRVA